MAGFVGFTLTLFSPLIRRLCSTPEKRIFNETSPYIWHKVLGNLRGKNLLIIGDVHGCYDEAVTLIEIAKGRSEKELEIVFVGDMVNKGPKNLEMLEFIRQSATNIHCIRGNHEQKVLDEYLKFLKTGNAYHDWIKQITKAQFEFMRNLPYSISIPDIGALVVHAGIVPWVELHDQLSNNMLNMRNLVANMNDFGDEELCATSDPSRGTSWAESWHGVNKSCHGTTHVYFGHDAVRKLQKHPHCTGLDTGCVYGGCLTGVLFHLDDFPQKHDDINKEFLSVKPSEVYQKVDDT